MKKNKDQFLSFLINVVTSGKYTEKSEFGLSDYLIRYVLMNIMIIIGLITMALFIVSNVKNEFYVSAVINLLSIIVYIAAFLLLRKKNIKQIVPAWLITVFYFFMCVSFIYYGAGSGASFLYIYVSPLFAIMTLGLRNGVAASIVLLVAASVEMFIPGVAAFNYHPDFAVRMVINYILILLMMIIIETTRKTKDKIVESQRKNLQKMAEEKVEVAEMGSKAKSMFLARMSHEIRTPMNAIIGITEIELNREEIIPETKEGLLKIYNSGYTLLGIINDILDMSKIEAGKLELIPAQYETASLINDAVQLNITRIGSKPIEFELNVSENLPVHLIGDELRIKQIMNNLLSNAFKYTEKGNVTLKITTEEIQNSGHNADAALLVIAVRDTGQGMSEEQVERLFDEYSRFNTEANRTTEGTGLGMSITKNLIQMMDGTFSVESKPGIGSAFTVHLMQQTAGSAVIGKELAQRLRDFRFLGESQIKKSQIVREYMPYGSVLVVDDLDTNLFVAKGLMTPYGLKIETASSGFEAFKKIQGGAVYDIVFMDHMMPVMDGIEATKRCREAGYTQPIVALTANAIAGQADIFLESGFDGFISKPIDIRELNTVLNKFIRDKAGSREQRAMSVSEADYQHAKITNNNTVNCSLLSDNSLTIPGVDTAKGIAMTGGTEALYRQVLALFRKDAEERLPLLQTAPEAELPAERTSVSEGSPPVALPVFVTQVHALKSALASLGAAEISAEAEQLEAAGKTGNFTFIQENLPAFAVHLAELVDSINAALQADKTGHNDEPAGGYAALLPLFRELESAFNTQNTAEIDRILDLLNEKPMDAQTREVIEKIADNVLMAEFDNAIKTLREVMAADSSPDFPAAAP